MLQKYLLDWWSNNVKDFPLMQNACGCQACGEGMRRGLSCAEWWAFSNKKINKTATKLPRRGKKRTAGRLGKAGSAHDRGTYENELAQDCKHKEIIKGANEEGNELTEVGEINQ